MTMTKRVADAEFAVVTVDEQLRNYLTPLTDMQRTQLHEKLDQYGILHPLLAARLHGPDSPLVLIDGHNRLEWYVTRGALSGWDAPRVTVLNDVRSPLDARVAMIELQLARRNQTEHEVRLERGRLLQLRVQQERERGTLYDAVNNPEGTTQREIAEEIADTEGVSAKTIRRSADLVKALEAIAECDPHVASAIEADEYPLSAAQILEIASGDTQAHCTNLREGRPWNHSGERLATTSRDRRKSANEKRLERLIQRFATLIETLIPAVRTELITISRDINSRRTGSQFPDGWDDSLESVYGQLIAWKPQGPCPDCNMAGCVHCDHLGWVRRAHRE